MEFSYALFFVRLRTQLFIYMNHQVQVNVLPVESAERCAKAIMRSVCRGDRYLLEPSWIGCVILWKVFCSEVTESVARWMLMVQPTLPMTEAPTKKILDVANAFRSFFSLPHYLLLLNFRDV